jgi:hypothetical protein
MHSMRSWRDSGLLSLVAERLAILSDPMPEEIAMAKYFGFTVVQPKHISGATTTRDNVMTIGGAFYYAMHMVRSEYVIFLENDFAMDTSLSLDTIRLELLAAVGLINRGASDIIRLLSRRGQGCGTFVGCGHNGISFNYSPNLWKWFAYYCRDHIGAKELGRVADCIINGVSKAPEGGRDNSNGGSASPDVRNHQFSSVASSTIASNQEKGESLPLPEYRCFTSWDSNWSLNAVLLRRKAMLEAKYSQGSTKMSLASIGLHFGGSVQDGFENAMAYQLDWTRWKVPICISYQGLFLHEEIETGA